VIPWVFHRDGAPIKDFRGAWQTACENAGVPDVGDRDDYQRTFALAQCPIESEASARLQSRSQRTVPITYRATSIYLNKQLVAEIDFRRFAKNDNESLTISIPPNAVRSAIVSC